MSGVTGLENEQEHDELKRPARRREPTGKAERGRNAPSARRPRPTCRQRAGMRSTAPSTCRCGGSPARAWRVGRRGGAGQKLKPPPNDTPRVNATVAHILFEEAVRQLQASRHVRPVRHPDHRQRLHVHAEHAAARVVRLAVLRRTLPAGPRMRHQPRGGTPPA